MEIKILTLFPGIFTDILNYSLLKKSTQKGLITFSVYNIRDFSQDKHKKVDDSPYGGGPGMVIKPQPVYNAFKFLNVFKKNKPFVIYPSPQGELFNNKLAQKLAKKNKLLFLCGHYEGIDNRILKWVDIEISIGDYVLTGGELPTLVIIDTLVRFIPGVVGNRESIIKDSFYNGLLDYPVYTRPKIFKGMSVPKVLLSGNHQKIQLLRLKESLKRTYLRRPDLIEKYKFNNLTKKLFNEIKKEIKSKKV